MPAGNTSYSDFSAPNGNGYLYYMVEIVLDAPCVLTKSLSSIKSNIATNDPDDDDTGVKELKIDNGQLRIYPNPTTGQLHITRGHAPLWEEQTSGHAHLWEDAVVEIYSVVGQLLLQGTLQNETTNINVESLANGMYFLQIGNKTVRFVKQ